jgi:DNA-binding beta-propeller fold protein YncE
MLLRAAPLLAVLALGCTADTPPPSTPVREPVETRLDDGTPVVLDPVARELRVGDETVAAGFAPTHVVVGAGGRIYVTDTGGGSVLLFRTRPHLKLQRRAAVPGRPFETVLDPDRRRLLVATDDELVRMTADGAPRIQERIPAPGADGEIRRLPSPDE